jgi:hypothetical protein
LVGEDARRIAGLRRLGFDEAAVRRRIDAEWKRDTDFGGAEVVQHLVLAGG